MFWTQDDWSMNQMLFEINQHILGCFSPNMLCPILTFSPKKWMKCPKLMVGIGLWNVAIPHTKSTLYVELLPSTFVATNYAMPPFFTTFVAFTVTVAAQCCHCSCYLSCCSCFSHGFLPLRFFSDRCPLAGCNCNINHCCRSPSNPISSCYRCPLVAKDLPTIRTRLITSLIVDPSLKKWCIVIASIQSYHRLLENLSISTKDRDAITWLSSAEDYY